MKHFKSEKSTLLRNIQHPFRSKQFLTSEGTSMSLNLFLCP